MGHPVFCGCEQKAETAGLRVYFPTHRVKLDEWGTRISVVVKGKTEAAELRVYFPTSNDGDV